MALGRAGGVGSSNVGGGFAGPDLGIGSGRDGGGGISRFIKKMLANRKKEKTLDTLPDIPNQISPAVLAARRRERMRASRSGGRSSTILTAPGGGRSVINAGLASTTSNTLLGV